jgi:hypothetical protein
LASIAALTLRSWRTMTENRTFSFRAEVITARE